MNKTRRSIPIEPLSTDPELLRSALRAPGPPYPGPRILPRDMEGRLIQRYTLPEWEHTPPRGAAVVALLHSVSDAIHLLLIRRAEHDGHHGGQIGLPGGSIESSDSSPLAAALRELHEEVGIAADQLDLWGGLEGVYIPVSHFMVQPFVAWSVRLPPVRPDPVEVAEVLHAPLSVFLDPASLVEEEWELRGKRVVMPYFRLGTDKVWGATALIIDQILWRLGNVA